MRYTNFHIFSFLLLAAFFSNELYAQKPDTIQIYPKGLPFVIRFGGLSFTVMNTYNDQKYPHDTLYNKTTYSNNGPDYGHASVFYADDSSNIDNGITYYGSGIQFSGPYPLQIQDTIVITFTWSDSPFMVDHDEYDFSIRVVIDSAKNVLSSLLYKYDEMDYRMRGGGNSHYRLLLEDIPYVMSADHTLKILLKGPEVASRIQDFFYSSYSKGEYGALLSASAEIYTTLIKTVLDSAHLVLELSLGNMAPVNKVNNILQKSILLFPNPVTNFLHLEFPNPSTSAHPMILQVVE